MMLIPAIKIVPNSGTVQAGQIPRKQDVSSTSFKVSNHSSNVSATQSATTQGLKPLKLVVLKDLTNTSFKVLNHSSEGLKFGSNVVPATFSKGQILSRAVNQGGTAILKLQGSNFSPDRTTTPAAVPSSNISNRATTPGTVPSSNISFKRATIPTTVPSSLNFKSGALSATYSEGQNLPKIIGLKDGRNTSSLKSQVSYSSVQSGASILRKIPNRQKSLSLQKNKIVSKAVLVEAGKIASEEPCLEIATSTTSSAPKPCPVIAASKTSPAPKPCPVIAASKSSPAPKPYPEKAASKTSPAPKPCPVIAASKPSPELAPKPCTEIDEQLQSATVSQDPPNCLLDAADERPNIFREVIEDMLPPNYFHHVVSIEPIRVYHAKEYDESSMFMAVVRVDLRTKDEALKWVKDYTENSCTDWRVRRCFKENTKFLIYKKVFRCHNNTMTQYRKGNVKAHHKHTECAASLHVTIKNFNMTRSSDPHLKKYPAEIVIHHCHNHPLEAAENLKYRRPPDELKDKFGDLFRSGHSPSSALHMHQYDLQMKSGDAFFKVLADGIHCPNLQWCYNLYRRIFSKDYGAPTGEGMLTSLKSAVQKYNEDCGSICASVEVFEEKDIVVALCTPLMKRVHQLRSSGEMAFLDSGGCMDRQNNRVFTLLAPSAAGALPEGLIITSTESEKAIYKGLKMLMDIVPPEAFGGRGSQGPQIIMTDDSTSERNALKMMFPGIILLLCLFHVLQAMWRYLWDSKHKVDPSDKLEIYMLFRDACYAENVDDFKEKYESMLAHPKVKGNPGLVKHFKDVYERAPEWSLAYRVDLLTRGNRTNNYSEATVRLMKDLVFLRLKAYSEVQMFDFFITRLEAYFERRLANVLNGRQENYWKSKHFIHPSKLIPLRCEKTSHDGFYLVKNVEHLTEYVVDMEHEVCSCPVGRNGAPCKHQMAVVQTFNIVSSQFLPVDMESKLALHRIMTTVAPPAEWYASLKRGPYVPNADKAAADNSLDPVKNTSPDEAGTTEITDIHTDIHESQIITESDKVIYDQTKLAAVLQKWEDISTYTINSMKSRPDVFVDAVDKFITKFQRAKEASENQLVSAFHTFNNQSAGHRSVVRKYIYVNSNSVQKRKQPSLGGRKCTQQGRPPKSTFTSEHGYSQVQVQTTAWNKLPTKRSAMPHNLAHKVSEQSHAAKKKPKYK